jgi:hypothetical protein
MKRLPNDYIKDREGQAGEPLEVHPSVEKEEAGHGEVD